MYIELLASPSSSPAPSILTSSKCKNIAYGGALTYSWPVSKLFALLRPKLIGDLNVHACKRWLFGGFVGSDRAVSETWPACCKSGVSEGLVEPRSVQRR
jgi:hypothetical protein